MSLRAQHSSRSFVERDPSTNSYLSSSLLLLFFFFLVLFSKCTANYPPLISSRSPRSAPGSRRITRRDSGTLASLPSSVRVPRSMSKCYSSSLFLFFFYFFYLCFYFIGSLFSSPNASSRAGRKGTSHRDRDRSLPARPRTRQLQIKKNHLLVCMLVFSDRKKKKNNLTQVGMPGNYIFPVWFLLYGTNLKEPRRITHERIATRKGKLVLSRCAYLTSGIGSKTLVVLPFLSSVAEILIIGPDRRLP